LADEQERAADHGNVATAQQVGESADEGADSGRSQEVASNEPDPRPFAADLVVDDLGYAPFSLSAITYKTRR